MDSYYSIGVDPREKRIVLDTQRFLSFFSLLILLSYLVYIRSEGHRKLHQRILRLFIKNTKLFFKNTMT